MPDDAEPVTLDADAVVVIVSHESAALLPRCLAAVRAGARRPLEVIVVDNGSRDGSPDVAAAAGARVIARADNAGFAAATNAGIAASTATFVVLLNPDAFPDPGAIDVLLDRLKRSPGVGIVGARLRYESGEPQPSAARFPSLAGGVWMALGLHRAPVLGCLPLGVLAHPVHYRRARRVDWVTGAFCAARCDVGPLPEESFMYGEDVEWARQAAARGLETWVEPAASGVHVLGASVAASSFAQERRVAFEDRWFADRGPLARLAARGTALLHALVRLGAVAVKTRRLRGPGAEPWWALARAALRRRAPS
jgi:GT2 family glycosyltransferase